MEIVQQLNILLPNVPGSLAQVTDRLRAADVNLVALSCTEGKSSTVFHVVVDDLESAKLALQPSYKATVTEVLCFHMKNKPGAIASIGRMCAGAGLNVRNIYATTCGKEATIYVAFSDENLAQAKKTFATWNGVA